MILLVFLLALLTELAFCRWTHRTVDGKPLQAAGYSGLIQLMGLSSIALAMADWRLIIPNAVGHALGSWYETNRRKEENALGKS